MLYVKFLWFQWMSFVACGSTKARSRQSVVFMTKVSKLFIDPDWELMIKYLQSCLGLAKDELKAPGLSDHQWRSEAAVRDMGSGEDIWQLVFYWVRQIYIWLGASKNNEVTKFEDDSDDDDWSEKPAKKDDKIKKPPEKEESRKKESTFLGGVFGKNKETVPPKLPTRKIVGERFEKIAKTETFYIAMTTL